MAVFCVFSETVFCTSSLLLTPSPPLRVSICPSAAALAVPALQCPKAIFSSVRACFVFRPLVSLPALDSGYGATGRSRRTGPRNQEEELRCLGSSQQRTCKVAPSQSCKHCTGWYIRSLPPVLPALPYGVVPWPALKISTGLSPSAGLYHLASRPSRHASRP